MTRRILHPAALIVLSFVGLFASVVLLGEHLSPASDHAWLNAACGEDRDHGMSDCENAFQSRWGKVLGMPTAFWGLVYFAGLAFWITWTWHSR